MKERCFQKVLSCLILGLIPFTSLQAQDSNWLNQSAQSNFDLQGVQFSVPESALVEESRHFLTKELDQLSDPSSGLQLRYHKSSPVGYHISFVQTYRGTPVYNSSAKVNLGPDKTIQSLLYKTANTKGWQIEPFEWTHSDSLISAKTGFEGKINVQSIIFYNGQSPQYAKLVNLNDVSSGLNREVIFDRNMNILKEKNRNLYNRGGDTTILGKVFLPNPLKSARQYYGKPYWDNEDKNTAALNDERVLVRMKADEPKNDTFYLEGPHVEIKDFSWPNKSTPFSLDGYFTYKRDSSSFEGVNAYYHINRFQEYIQSLGYQNTANYPIPVDPHGSKGDRSFFGSTRDTNVGRLYLGLGGVDDGEDAEVIIHEYSHAISENVSPGSFDGSDEARALDEGLADYFACSYSRHLSNFRWERLFFWDGGIKSVDSWAHWSGRWCTTNRQYPEDLGQGRYNDGEIWAGTFMEIWSKIGRNVTDKLMLAAVQGFSGNITMRQAANLFLQADSVLYNGRHYNKILKEMAETGLVKQKRFVGFEDKSEDKSLSLRVYNTGNKFHVELANRHVEGHLLLQSAEGKVLRRKPVNRQQDIYFDHTGLAKGIYFIRFAKQNKQTVKKVVK